MTIHWTRPEGGVVRAHNLDGVRIEKNGDTTWDVTTEESYAVCRSLGHAKALVESIVSLRKPF